MMTSRISGAPICAGGASPLRVATGGSANWSSGVRSRRSPARANRRRDSVLRGLEDASLFQSSENHGEPLTHIGHLFMTNPRASLRSDNCPISIGMGVRFGLEQVSAFVGIRKGGQQEELPLPADAARAIVQYLRRDRPRCACRRVFIGHRAPIGGFRRAGAIACLVKRALTKAGVESARKGAHLLRHSLATDMLRKGASLEEIGEVLRHRSPDTTAIYAKVDLSSLRKLALHWPGGAR